MAFVADQESNIAAFGGGGHSGGYGMSGSWSMIILVVVVLWLLFKDGHNNNVYAGHHGNGGHCYDLGSNVKDMPDYMVDRDVINQGCQSRALAAAEGEKTRALIMHNQERADDKAYQELMLANLQKDSQIQTLALENNFQQKLSLLGNEVERGFAGISHLVDNINCNMVKRPPYYAQGYVPGGEPVPPVRSCV